MRALDVGGGVYSPADIARAVAEGKMQSWVLRDSLIVTEVLRYPRKSLVNVTLAMGDLGDVLELETQLGPFGKSMGCEKLVMAGRPGWMDVLPKVGWTKTNKVMLEKELD